MAATPNGKLVFYREGQIKIYDPTTEELQEASFNHQMYWDDKIFGNSTILGHYQANLWKYDFSDINNITEELVFNGGDRSIEHYFEDGDAIYFGVNNNGNRTLFKKVGDESTVLYQGNDVSFGGLFIYNDRVLLIRSYRIYELINPGPDSYFVYTNQIRDNNGSDINIYDYKVFTHNNELYAISQNNLPGKLTIPSEFQGNNIVTPIFTPLSSIEPTGDIQSAGFDSITGNLFTHNISYNEYGNSVYAVNSYRVAPVIKILAGQTSGTFNIAGKTDELYELTESIIIQPGTPTNASFSDALVTNGVANSLDLELTDNDEIPAVVFEFSAPTIDENSSTTVTLTASSVSGVEITIPFTLTQDATSAVLGEEFIIVDDVRQIVIPANGNSASITISTTGLDDTEVEIQEPITFNFGTITNATSDTENITLFLESDDPSKISAIATTGLINSQVEDGSFEVFASVEKASSKDVTIPVTLSGDATLNEDYTVSFDSEGEEITILNNGQTSYGKMTATPNGKLVFYQQGQIKIYDPTTEELQEATFYDRMSWNSKVFGNSTMLGHYQANLWKYDFSDINNITEELVFNGGERNIENYFEDGEAIYFSIYNNGNRTLFKKVGDESTVLYDGNESFDGLFIYNDRVLLIRSNRIYELINPGPDSFFRNDRIKDNNGSYTNIYDYKVFTHNNELYTISDNNLPGKLTIPSELQGNSIDNPIFTPFSSIEPTGDIQSAGFDSITGNLFTHNISYNEQGNSVYAVNSYRVAPVIKIPAGQTTGTFNIAGIDDELFELTESLVVSPGTPVNATYSDALVAEGVAIPVTLELEDNDTESEVIFEFSSPTIDENSSTTVTLTATSDSGAEITIPFTITQDASSAVLGEEFIIVDDVSQIVIPANGTSASITISTTGLDDTVVEIQEPITFNFGTITNATSETTEITLLLNSDDDPVITSIGTTGDVTSQVEDGSFEVTASINLPTSKEVTIPFTLSGDAIFNEDFTVSFDSEGEKSLLYNSDQSFGKMKILPDGKYIFLEGQNLRIYNPEDNSLITKQLGNSYEGNIGIGVVNNTSFYAKINPGSIYKVDFSDLEAITETPYIDLQQNSWVPDPFTLSGETLYYTVYDNNSNQRTQFKKVGDADPEILGTFNDGVKIVETNDKLFFIGNYFYLEYEGEQLTNNDRLYFNMNNFNLNYSELEVYNNEIYTVNTNANNKPGKLSISGTQVSFSPLPVTETASINYLDVDSTTGNLILQVSEYTNSNYSYSVNSYQLAPQLKIAAGETSGTFTITGKDDDLFELAESLIVLPSAAKNATFSDDLLTDGIANPLTLELTDNDEFSDVVFEFSSPTIDENSSTTVTLTASSVSGAEITIPFTITQDAASAVLDEEYVIVDDVRQIVIPANGNSASITISTQGLDDEEVEIQEPIIFTFGDIVNATTETQDATLYIVSDDDPNFTGITVSKNEFAEHESSTVTANIDVPASRDVNVNLTFTGTATNNLDYSASFDNEGKKSLIENIGNESYGNMKVLPDGRFVFLHERKLRIYNPSDKTTVERQLSNYYDYNQGFGIESNGVLYAGRYEVLYKLDITDIDAITETPHISLQNNVSFQHHWSNFGDTIIYQVYDNNDSSNPRKVFRKIGDADPEIIFEGDQCCYTHIILNDKIYAISDYRMYEIIDGEYVNQRYFNSGGRLNSQRTVVYNNEIYSIESESNTIVKLVMSEEEYTQSDGSTYVQYNVFLKHFLLLKKNKLNILILILLEI
jgi:DNA/RNA endonuclease YhcR with UshA esterase domain